MVKKAFAKFEKKNSVEGFNLYFFSQEGEITCHGHYPCDEGRWKESMKMAVADALDYGFTEGVSFMPNWENPI
jgi:hypothetical protein